jgi:hypothetical protein
MENNADALYTTIFETIAALKDKNAPMDLDRAKTISSVIQTAVNLAKVEVDHIKATSGNVASFFNVEPKAIGKQPKVITHRLGN